MRPLKYALRDVPHLVLEPNLTCDQRCRSCYVTERGYVKSLEEIRAELDVGLRKRAAETVSILGGEPTMHPELPAIVREVKRRSVTCQILTNGVALQRRPELLVELLAAGVDRIMLHADIGQGRAPAELDRFIDGLFDRFERAPVAFGLVLTVYPESRRRIATLARRHAHHRHFDGILATLAIDTHAAGAPATPPPDAPTLLDEHRAIAAELGVDPTTYVPSNLDDGSPRWLIYFYFLNSATGRTFAISPRVDDLCRRLLRRLHGRYAFAAPLRPAWLVPVMIPALLVELALAPQRLLEGVRLLARSRWLGALRLQYLVLQTGPAFNRQRNAVEMCHHCPDATLRNGRLTPVCLADAISPLPPRGHAAPAVDEALRRAVYDHLGEA
jgi:pyruvate-formate lyase-activating enzyme